jgi:hypothetical protein
VHRTLTDKILLILSSRLSTLYHNGLEAAFAKNQESDSMQNSISEFKKCFEIPHYQRTQNMFQIL